MRMNIINLTNHDITIRPDQRTPSIKINIPSSNRAVRVHENYTKDYDSIPTNPPIEIRAIDFPHVPDMPEPKANTRYIVSRISAMVLCMVHNRYEDILFPYQKTTEADISVYNLGCYRNWAEEDAGVEVRFITELD